jgi:hypothetical protein
MHDQPAKVYCLEPPIPQDPCILRHGEARLGHRTSESLFSGPSYPQDVDLSLSLPVSRSEGDRVPVARRSRQPGISLAGHNPHAETSQDLTVSESHYGEILEVYSTVILSDAISSETGYLCDSP